MFPNKTIFLLAVMMILAVGCKDPKPRSPKTKSQSKSSSHVESKIQSDPNPLAKPSDQPRDQKMTFQFNASSENSTCNNKTLSMPIDVRKLKEIIGEPDRVLESSPTKEMIWDKHGLVLRCVKGTQKVDSILFGFNIPEGPMKTSSKFSGVVTWNNFNFNPKTSMSEFKEIKGCNALRKFMAQIEDGRYRVIGGFDRNEQITMLGIKYMPK